MSDGVSCGTPSRVRFALLTCFALRRSTTGPSRVSAAPPDFVSIAGPLLTSGRRTNFVSKPFCIFLGQKSNLEVVVFPPPPPPKKKLVPCELTREEGPRPESEPGAGSERTSSRWPQIAKQNRSAEGARSARGEAVPMYALSTSTRFGKAS